MTEAFLFHACIVVVALRIGQVGFDYVKSREVRQTKLIASIPNDEARWKRRVHDRAVAADVGIACVLVLLVVFLCGFVQTYQYEREVLLARRDAAWSRPCPYHCACHEGVPVHSPDLSLQETLYYNTIGPTHEQECADYQRDIHLRPWPNVVHLLGNYIQDILVYSGETVGAIAAGFIYKLPYGLQLAIYLTAPIVMAALLAAAPYAVAALLAREAKNTLYSHAYVHDTRKRDLERADQRVVVEDVTDEGDDDEVHQTVVSSRMKSLRQRT